MPQPQQPPSNVNGATEQFRNLLSNEVTETGDALARAESVLAAAQEAIDSARAAATKAQKDFGNFNTSFPAAAPSPPPGKKARESETAAGKKSASGRPPGRPRKNAATTTTTTTTKKSTGRVVLSRPVPIPTGSAKLTVPQRVARVIGKSVMTAGEAEDALDKAGEVFGSKKMRVYLSTILNASTQVVYKDGMELKDKQGKTLKVHMFTAVSRGQYRVATLEDITNEVQKLTGASEVVISNDTRTPIDRMLEDQGIEVRPGLSAVAH